MDGFTWLTYPATGGVFHCPDAAAEDWVGNGWQPCDAPAEVNPAVAERIAAQQELATTTTTTTKPRRGDSQEMSNG